MVRFIEYLLLERKFRKIRFICVKGNPIESAYNRFIDSNGGRKVGYYEKEDKLIDGEYHDSILYEITRERFIESSTVALRSGYDRTSI